MTNQTKYDTYPLWTIKTSPRVSNFCSDFGEFWCVCGLHFTKCILSYNSLTHPQIHKWNDCILCKFIGAFANNSYDQSGQQWRKQSANEATKTTTTKWLNKLNAHQYDRGFYVVLTALNSADWSWFVHYFDSRGYQAQFFSAPQSQYRFINKTKYTLDLKIDYFHHFHGIQ